MSGILTAPHLGVPVEDLAEGGDQLGRVAHEVEQHDGHGHPGQPHLPPPQRVVARPGAAHNFWGLETEVSFSGSGEWA